MRRFFIVLALALWVDAALTSVLLAQGEAEVTGTLTLVWGDPVDGSEEPRYRVMLASDTGTIELEVGQHLVARAREFSGRRVLATVGIEPVAPNAMGRVPARLIAVAAAEGTGLFAGGAGAAAAFPPAPEWARVTRPYAILLCRFADIATEPRTPGQVQDAYLGPIGSAESFFNEVSAGRLTLTGSTVLGWFTLPEPRSGYVTNDSPDLTKLAQHCLNTAADQLDFTQIGGVSINVNGSLGCCAWGGATLLQADGVSRVVPSIWMPNALAGGIVWHELGHSFGLPHSGGPYGRTYDSRWDVMSSSGGLYLGPVLGSGGSHFNAWHKDRLGLIPRGRVLEVSSGTRSLVLEPSAFAPPGTNPQYVFLPLAGRPGFGFTVEARWRRGYDRAVPRQAVLIHSIDPGRAEPAQVVDPDGNGNPNDLGASWTIGEQFGGPGGIRVVIDSITSNGFGVTVSNGSDAGPSLATSGASVERDAGDAVWFTDSVRVQGAGWTARERFRSAWLRIDRTSGTAGDYLTWSVRGSEVTPGRYVDTVIVESAGAAHRATYTIELGVSGMLPQPRLSRPGAWRAHRPLFQLCDSVAIQLPAPYTHAAWTAVRTQRIQVASGLNTCFSGASPQASGTGSAMLRFTHATSNTAGVTFVDSIRVSVANFGDLVFVDTIETLPTPTLGLSGLGVRHDLVFGEVAPVDSVTVTNTSTVPGATWFLFRRRSTTRGLLSTGQSGGHMTWTHRTTLGSPGTMVDTIRACDTYTSWCSDQAFIDTMVLADVPASLRVRRWSPVIPLRRGSGMRTDSAAIELLGTAATAQPWAAWSTSLRVTFHSLNAFVRSASGTGSGWLKWSYDVSGLGPGLYVDTIHVRADGVPGSPAMIIDTLKLEGPLSVAGDVDGDGSILAGDAQAILQFLVGMAPRPGWRITPNGDANCDGSVTALDAMLIMQADLGIPPAAHCLGRALPAATSHRTRHR
jgi:hypothetical protein